MSDKSDSLIFTQELDEMMDKADFSQALSVSQVPALAKRQAQKQANQKQTALDEHQFVSLFDKDVIGLVLQHANNPQDLSRMNGILRALMVN